MKAHTQTLWLVLMTVNIVACSGEYGLKQGQANNRGHSADASSALAAADDAKSADACALASTPVPAVCTGGTFTCQDPAAQPALSVMGSCSVALVQQQLFAQACKAGLAIAPSQLNCIANADPAPTPQPAPKDPIVQQPTAPTPVPLPPSDGNPACTSAKAPISLVCRTGSFTCTGGGLTVTGQCSDGIVSQQLLAKACSLGVTLTPAMITCDDSGLDPTKPVLPPDGGGSSCGPIPDVGLTAEQTICCNDGKWITQLGYKFGGPATCGGSK